MQTTALATPKPVSIYKQAMMVEVGGRAFVTLVKHPRLGNQGTARTGTIIRHDPETGEFETKRTIYKKATA